LRFVFASFFVIPFVINKLPKKYLWKLFLLSLFAAGNVVLFSFGIQYTTAMSSSIIYLLSPIIVLIFSVIFLKNKFSKLNILWVFFALFWAILVVLLPVIYGADYNMGWILGNMLILLAMVSFTVYTIRSKSLQKLFSAEAITAWFLFVTLCITGVVSFFNKTQFVSEVINLSPMAWISIWIVWLLWTWLQYLLQQLVIKKNSSSNWSLFLYIQPLAVVILAVPILWEKVTYVFVIGAVLAILWVWLSSKKSK
jgi:drug/metabolite transporter (DMT)-like permease